MNAKEFWKKQFDEYPQNDAEKLAVTMMAQYGEELNKQLETGANQYAKAVADNSQLAQRNKELAEALKEILTINASNYRAFYYNTLKVAQNALKTNSDEK